MRGERAEVAPEVDGGGGAERIELAGLGAESGGEHHGHEQADDAVGELREDEADKDVIGILDLRPRVGGGEGGLGFRAHRGGGGVGRNKFRAGRGLSRRIMAGAGGLPDGDLRLFHGVEGGVFFLQGAEHSAVGSGGVMRPLRAVEKDGGGLELVEDEDQRAEQQDEELHRDLQQRVEHEAEPALAQRGAADVALHLRLIGAEVGERQEESAEQAGPESVALGGIERKIHGLELAQGAGEVGGPGESEPVGQPHQHDDKRRGHAGEDDRHLPFLREAHGDTAAGDGVDYHQQTGADDGEIEPPAEHRGYDDGGRIDGDTRGETALDEEESGAEETGFAVESPAEIFIGGVNAEPAVDGQENRADDDERERQAEIILDETDAAFEALPGDREKGDGAGLRGRDRETDGEPTRALAALEIGVEVVGVARAPRAIGRDADHRPEEHEPVDGVHAKTRANRVSAMTTRMKQPKTKR